MIIGITGKKRSGKDTIADYLVENYRYHKASLAAPMKRFAMDVFGWTEEWIETEKETVDPRHGISYRQFMQWIGTDAMQHKLGEDFPEFGKITGRKVWIKKLLSDSLWNTVTSDVRFPHEADAIRDAGGIILQVVRPGLDNDDAHASEMEMDSIDADYVIHNDSTLDYLYFQITAFINSL